MKILLTVSLVMLSLFTNGQDYNLFKDGSQKLFTTSPTEGPTFGVSFDSVIYAGDYSIYFNYTGIGSEIESDTCLFWGGPICISQDKPLWLGDAVTLDFMGTYHFKTYQDNFLSFNFELSPGDSSLFYQDASQLFYMIYEGADTAQILDVLDSVRCYRIAHYDLEGNTIDSPLNDEQIIIGMESGLAGFFRIDSFPTVLQPLLLIGNTSPPAGIINLTNEMVYDHHIGDIIQYEDRYNYPEGPPEFNYLNYIKHLFLDRIDLQDSIYYSVERTTYKPDSNLIIKDTVFLKYERERIIATLPFDKFNQAENLVLTKFYKADYCDSKFWTFSRAPQYLVYCPGDNCWGSYDIPGPPPDEETIIVCGLGIYSDYSSLSAPPPQGYYYSKRIVFFKKEGLECGEEVIVSIESPKYQDFIFDVYPNPARNVLYIVTGEKQGLISVYDLEGRLIKLIPTGGSETGLNIGNFANGVYLVKFLTDSFVGTKKIIIAGN